MKVTSEYGIEYDTSWIKDRCVLCDVEFFEAYEERKRRYEQRGNWCKNCSENTHIRKKVTNFNSKKSSYTRKKPENFNNRKSPWRK